MRPSLFLYLPASGSAGGGFRVTAVKFGPLAARPNTARPAVPAYTYLRPYARIRIRAPPATSATGCHVGHGRHVSFREYFRVLGIQGLPDRFIPYGLHGSTPVFGLYKGRRRRWDRHTFPGLTARSKRGHPSRVWFPMGGGSRVQGYGKHPNPATSNPNPKLVEPNRRPNPKPACPEHVLEP